MTTGEAPASEATASDAASAARTSDPASAAPASSASTSVSVCRSLGSLLLMVWIWVADALYGTSSVPSGGQVRWRLSTLAAVVNVPAARKSTMPDTVSLVMTCTVLPEKSQ